MKTNDERAAFPFDRVDSEASQWLRKYMDGAPPDPRQSVQETGPASGVTDSGARQETSSPGDRSAPPASLAASAPPSANAGTEGMTPIRRDAMTGKPFIAAMVAVLVAAAIGASAGFYFASRSAGLALEGKDETLSRYAITPAAAPAESANATEDSSAIDTMPHRMAAIRMIAAEDADDHVGKQDAARPNRVAAAPAAAPAKASPAATLTPKTCTAAALALSLCSKE